MTDDAVEDMKVRDEQEMVRAKLELDAAVEAYTSVLQAGGRGDVETAKIRLHRAVVGLWWRLQPVLLDEEAASWESVEDLDEWHGDVIWAGQHPRTGQRVVLEGLKDVGEWLDCTTTQERSLSGPKYGGRTETVSVQLALPGEAALRCADLLSREFRDLGWGASVESTPRTEIDGELMERVHEWMEKNGGEAA